MTLQCIPNKLWVCVHRDYWQFHPVNNSHLSLSLSLSLTLTLTLSFSGTLKFVGLRPFDDEKRHWVALNTSIALQQLKDNQELHPRQEEELKRQTSITPKEAAVIKAISGHSIRTPLGPTSPALTTPSPRITTPPILEETDGGGVVRQRSVVEPDFDARAAWRRAATLRKTELKPDLWKVAYNSIKSSVTAPRDQVNRIFVVSIQVNSVHIFISLLHCVSEKSIPKISIIFYWCKVCLVTIASDSVVYMEGFVSHCVCVCVCRQFPSCLECIILHSSHFLWCTVWCVARYKHLDSLSLSLSLSLAFPSRVLSPRWLP